MEIQPLDMSSLPSLHINSTCCVRHHKPLLWTVADVWLSLEYLNPAEMTDDRGCHRSHTDMSLFVKASVAGLCKSKDLVNKCSEAVKINCSYHANSFISSATDLFNYLSTKRAIIPFWAAAVHFHVDDARRLGHERVLNSTRRLLVMERNFHMCQNYI